MKVVAMGHACVDVLPAVTAGLPGMEPGILYPVGPLAFRLGGSVPNTGGALAALGVDVVLHCSMGDDPLGRVGGQLLADMGADVHLVPSDTSTSYSIVIESGDHDRTIWQHEGSNVSFRPSSLDLGALEADLVHLGYPSLLPKLSRQPELLRSFFASARARGTTTSLDLAHVAPGSLGSTVDWSRWFRLTLPEVDLVSPSWDDLGSALGLDPVPSAEEVQDVADLFIARGAAAVAISNGARGFLLQTADAGRLSSAGRALEDWTSYPGGRWWIDAEEISHPATTLGAGDTLTAGLIHGITLGMSPLEAAHHARSIVGRHLRGLSLR